MKNIETARSYPDHSERTKFQKTYHILLSRAQAKADKTGGTTDKKRLKLLKEVRGLNYTPGSNGEHHFEGFIDGSYIELSRRIWSKRKGNISSWTTASINEVPQSSIKALLLNKRYIPVLKEIYAAANPPQRR